MKIFCEKNKFWIRPRIKKHNQYTKSLHFQKKINTSLSNQFKNNGQTNTMRVWAINENKTWIRKLKKEFWFTMILLFLGLISRTVSWFSNAILKFLIGDAKILVYFCDECEKVGLCVCVCCLLGENKKREKCV